MTNKSDAEDKGFALLWDYCIVFKMDLDQNGSDTVAKQVSSYLPSFCKGKKPGDSSREKKCDHTPQSKQILETLHSRLVHTFTYLSVQKDELYCLLTVEESALRLFAERIGFKLEMDPISLEAFMKGKVTRADDDEESEDHETIAGLCSAVCGCCNCNSNSDSSSRTGIGMSDGAKTPLIVSLEKSLDKYRESHRIRKRPNISDGSDLKHKYGLEPPTSIPWNQYIFLKFMQKIPQVMYKHHPYPNPRGPAGSKTTKSSAETVLDDNHVPVPEPQGRLFSHAQRLKLTYYYLRSSEADGGCGIPIDQLLQPPNDNLVSVVSPPGAGPPKKREKEEFEKFENDKDPVFKGFFPLHNKAEAELIKKEALWLFTPPWLLPFNRIRHYFGEKVGLYFVFIGHYSKWLALPAVMGFFLELVVVASGDTSHPVLCFFGLIVAIWAISMLQYWKRAQSWQAMKWGMIGFEQSEPMRPEFYGVPMFSVVDGKRVIFFPENIADSRMHKSAVVVVSFVSFVVGVVASIYVLKFQLTSMFGSSFAGIAAGVANTVQITLLNWAYQQIAIKMTDNENRRTDTEYADSLISKLFIFQFINSFSSFFFLAFVAQYMPRPADAKPNELGQCGGPTCMTPLAVNLAIVFGTRMTVNNVMDFYNTHSAWKARVTEETANVPENTVLSPAENNYNLMKSKPMIDSIVQYADSAVQFGYVTLFVTALPAAPLLALASNHIMIKFATVKYLDYNQRTVPQGAEDIGMWEYIFNVVATASVLTNAGIVSFTMDVLRRNRDTVNSIGSMGGFTPDANFSSLACVWVFLGFVLTMFLGQYLADIVIEDEPDEVTVQKERLIFLNDKVIELVADWEKEDGEDPDPELEKDAEALDIEYFEPAMIEPAAMPLLQNLLGCTGAGLAEGKIDLVKLLVTQKRSDKGRDPNDKSEVKIDLCVPPTMRYFDRVQEVLDGQADVGLSDPAPIIERAEIIKPRRTPRRSSILRDQAKALKSAEEATVISDKTIMATRHGGKRPTQLPSGSTSEVELSSSSSGAGAVGRPSLSGVGRLSAGGESNAPQDFGSVYATIKATRQGGKRPTQLPSGSTPGVVGRPSHSAVGRLSAGGDSNAQSASQEFGNVYADQDYVIEGSNASLSSRPSEADEASRGAGGSAAAATFNPLASIASVTSFFGGGGGDKKK